MNGCGDKRFQNMPWAYQMGLLDDEERRAFELHILECECCRQDLKQFSDVALLIEHDTDVHQTIHRIAERGTASVHHKEREQASRRRLRLVSVPVILVTAVLLILLLKPWQVEFSTTKEAKAIENRLAIMYFDNLADRENTLQLGEIAANLLIADLSESTYLEVVSGQRLYDILKLMGREGQREIDRDVAQQVAESAQADLMIRGSILQTDPHFVLTAQLINVSTGSVIASQRILGKEGEDIFLMIDKLAVEIKNDLALPTAAGNGLDRPVADVTTHSPEAYRYYLNGVEFLQKYYRPEARECFTRAVELDSSFAMAYYYLTGLGDPELIEKAEKFIDNATLRDGYYIRSRRAAFLGNKAEAISELQELVERYPEEKEAHYLLGLFIESKGDYDLALEHLQKALKIDPLYKVAVNYLAYFWDRMGEYEQAIVTIDSYISLAPDEANPYDSRGEIYASNGKIELAIESYRRALEINPRFHNSIWNLGHLSCFKGEYALAESLYTITATDSDASIRVVGRLFLRNITVRQGKFTQALNDLDESIAADLADGQVGAYVGYKHFIKSVIYRELEDFDRAKTELETHMSIYRAAHPGDAAYVRHHLVQLLAENGDMTRAKEVAQSLRDDLEAERYELDEYWYAAGCIELASGNARNAVLHFEKITDPGRGFSEQFILGRAYLEAGLLPEAVSEFEQLLAIYTAQSAIRSLCRVKAHYYLALAYEKSNWYDKAIMQYEIFLDIWRDADPGIYEIEDAKVRLAGLRSRSS